MSAAIVFDSRVRRTVWVGLAIVLGACSDTSALTLDNAGAYFSSHRAALTAAAAGLRDGGFVTLSAPARWGVEINSHVMPLTIQSRTDARAWTDSVLQADGLSRQRYDRARALLQRAQVRYVTQVHGCTVFVVGGMLDNVNGFAYVPVGAAPLAADDEVDGGRVVTTQAVSDKWYYFATS